MSKVTPDAGQRLLDTDRIRKALLSKAGPAKWIDEDAYVVADQAELIGNALCEQVHRHLRTERTGYLFKKKLSSHGGKVTMAKASIVSPKLKFFAELDFLVDISWEMWMHHEPHQQDGMLRADARPQPAIILSFIARDGQRQAYPCDTFAWWQDNLYAIAVVLEDLRRAERYGVQSSLLRAGFKALPSSSTTTLTADRAAQLIAVESDAPALHILADADAARLAIRTALNRTHPDKLAGIRERYDRVDAARSVLTSHFGVSL